MPSRPLLDGNRSALRLRTSRSIGALLDFCEAAAVGLGRAQRQLLAQEAQRDTVGKQRLVLVP